MSNNGYSLIDSGSFKKLEQVGSYRIIRPSPQAVWSPRHIRQWDNVDAVYKRYSGGDGEWVFHRQIDTGIVIELAGVKFFIEPTEFGHLGVFPEQQASWRFIQKTISAVHQNCFDRPKVRVLNLFGYTGGATVAAALAGAEVVHVDASKTSVLWARRNAENNACSPSAIRWITDDVQKFVARELRRKNKYEAIVLDPPSFGRGTKGEVWKIEEHLVGLLTSLRDLLSEEMSFLMLSAHSNGYTPKAMVNLVSDALDGRRGHFDAHEMVIEESGSSRVLPSGSYCCFVGE